MAVLTAGAALVLAAYGRDRSTIAATRQQPRRHIADAPRYHSSAYRIGSPTAPLRVAIWTDYECPECGKFEIELGVVRRLLGDSLVIHYHHFPAIKTHPQSLPAAIIAECARAQGRFTEVHDALFRSPLVNLSGRFATDSRMRACVVSDSARRALEASRAFGFIVALQGTPSVLIGDSLFLGGMSANVLMARLRSARERQ